MILYNHIPRSKVCVLHVVPDPKAGRHLGKPFSAICLIQPQREQLVTPASILANIPYITAGQSVLIMTSFVIFREPHRARISMLTSPFLSFLCVQYSLQHCSPLCLTFSSSWYSQDLRQKNQQTR